MDINQLIKSITKEDIQLAVSEVVKQVTPEGIEAKHRGLVPKTGNWEKPGRWVKPQDKISGVEVEKTDKEKLSFLLSNEAVNKNPRTKEFITSVNKFHDAKGSITLRQKEIVDQIYAKHTGQEVPKVESKKSIGIKKVKSLADNMLRGEMNHGISAKQVEYLKNVIYQNLSEANIKERSKGGYLITRSSVNPTRKIIDFYLGDEHYTLSYWSRSGGGGTLAKNTPLGSKVEEEKTSREKLKRKPDNSMPIPNTIEEIDTELQALARARIRPWGGYDRTANVRLNSRFNELLNRKKELEKIS